MALSVNIQFGGDCREAVTFYAGALGLETPAFLTYGAGDTSFDENVQLGEADKDKIMRATLAVMGTTVIFNDMPGNFDFIPGNRLGLTLGYNDAEKAAEVFGRLAEGGMIFVPFAKVPGMGWYGMLGDRFGVSWTVTA